MSEKRFQVDYDEDANRVIYFDNQKPLTALETVDLLNDQQTLIDNQKKVLDLLMPHKCVDDLSHCKYFCWHRNYNYETCTNDTITLWCELLGNKETYTREEGDVIWENGFDDCPLKRLVINPVTHYCVDCKHCIGEPTILVSEDTGLWAMAYSCLGGNPKKKGMFPTWEEACEYWEGKI